MIVERIKSIIQRNKPPRVALYHLCSVDTANSLINRFSHNVRPEFFEQQVDTLQKKFQVIFIDELMERYQQGRSVEKLTAITFDDAYRSVLQEAAPILASKKIPFTFFVNGKILDQQIFWRDKVRHLLNINEVSSFLGSSDLAIQEDNFYKDTKNPRLNSRQVEDQLDCYFEKRGIKLSSEDVYCSWQDLAEAGSEFMMVGNHTYSHYVMAGLSAEEQSREISVNQQKIKEHFSESNVFSIPFGNPGTYNTSTLEAIHAHGYKAYVLSGPATKVKDFGVDSFKMAYANRFMPEDKPVLPANF